MDVLILFDLGSGKLSPYTCYFRAFYAVRVCFLDLVRLIYDLYFR